jgi:hypothetical protein
LSQGLIAEIHASGISIHLFADCQGCAGQDLEYQRVTIGRLQAEGFAVIAPDSFALSNRTQVCLMGDRHVWSVRATEARFAAEQAGKLPRVDAKYLFLVGHSEGGAGAAAYRGAQFNAIVISAFPCRDGIAADVPTLAVAYRNDTQLLGASVICMSANQHLIR